MLVLFETAAGYALFKVLKENKLKEPDELWKEFETPEEAMKTVKLIDFQKFENMNEAVASVSDLLEGKLSKGLKNFLKETFDDMETSSETLAVMDPKIGTTISKKFGIQVVSDKTVMELYRGIKQQLDALITGIKSEDINQMVLGLSHSLSRHRLKFSPDKVDNMIIQAIGLLDDLDKELNTYAMRVKEWYGWHFPEMSKIVVDNLAYAKVVKTMGFRSNAQTTDLSAILPEDLEKELKEAAEISMGSEIAREDIDNIMMGCEQVISLTEYRAELYEYLKNRMLAIAPNLTTIVGELVGARLIAHSGSLLNLAKHPASTVQILGAEKALFRALKTKNPTPKYGLIYHASLVGQAAPKNKGKVARLVATKSSLATRVDALSEEKDVQAELGHSNRKYIESRIRFLETGIKPEKNKGKNQKKAELIPATTSYNPSADVAGPSHTSGASTAGTKRKAEEITAAAEESEEESSEESDSTNSDDDKSKKKIKKTKKQKLKTEQEKEQPQPSKEKKAKEGKDKKKDKKEKKKEKSSEKRDPIAESSKTKTDASTRVDEPKAEGSKASKTKTKAVTKDDEPKAEGSKASKTKTKAVTKDDEPKVEGSKASKTKTKTVTKDDEPKAEGSKISKTKTVTKDDEPKAEGSKASKKRKKTEDEKKEESEPEKKVKKAKKSKEKSEEVKPKEEKKKDKKDKKKAAK